MATRRWASIPAVRSNSVSLKTKQYFLFALIIFLCLTGPISLVISLTKKSPQQVVSTSNGIGSHVALSKKFLQDYFSGTKTDVPTSPTVTEALDNYNNQEKLPIKLGFLDYLYSEDNSDSGINYKVNYFLLSINNISYKVSVVTSSSEGQTYIASLPSITQTDSFEGSPDPIDYLTYPQIDISEDVQSSIQNWAKSYFENDIEGLKASIDDTGNYEGLKGLSFIESSITSYIKNSSEPNTFYARVVVKYTTKSAKQLELSAEYDTLVFDDGAQIPHVVAWGSAGDTPLTPYQNKKGNK